MHDDKKTEKTEKTKESTKGPAKSGKKKIALLFKKGGKKAK